MNKVKWTKEEDAKLKPLWESGINTKIIMRHIPNRSIYSIQARARKLKLSNRRERGTKLSKKRQINIMVKEEEATAISIAAMRRGVTIKALILAAVDHYDP